MFHKTAVATYHIYEYCSVSSNINIEGRGVHQWYMMFDQQILNLCYITVFFSITLKDGRARLKGGGMSCYHPVWETLYLALLYIN